MIEFAFDIIFDTIEILFGATALLLAIGAFVVFLCGCYIAIKELIKYLKEK